MRIVITGAGGFIGSALAQHFSPTHDVLTLQRHDLDITDSQAIRQLFLNLKPDIVINCAVLGVDACEKNPTLAHAVNVIGPKSLAKATHEIGAEFLHLSTNYVFNGRREDNSCYTVRDTPKPINVYGKTKLAGEKALCAASPRSYIVRTSWVFGLGKGNFLSMVPRQLIAGNQLRAINDIRANATYILDLARRVEEILQRHHYAIYHVVNQGVCSYYEFALEAARLLGINDTANKKLIEAVSEAEIKFNAPRPRSTPLRCLVSEELRFEPMRQWRAALADYIQSTLKSFKREL